MFAVRVCLCVPSGHLLGGGGLASWLSFVVSNCEFVTFPLVYLLGQVWYLIVLIHDLCALSYFKAFGDRYFKN